MITDNEENNQAWELVVRKGAHMIEFAILGIAVFSESPLKSEPLMFS